MAELDEFEETLSVSETGVSQDPVYRNVEDALTDELKIKSKIEIKPLTIKVDDVAISHMKKLGRQDSLIGLSGIIGKWGIVSPIHVLKLEDDDSYMLLDGLRRVFGAIRANMDEIPAMVWHFDDIDEGKEIANILSLMINRTEKYKTKEIWEQMKVLEEVNNVSPNFIEYLLQMHGGDAMKLKDIMTSGFDYAEIRGDLMDGLLNIDAAYKKLTKERQKENRLAKEDATSLDEVVNTSVDNVADSAVEGIEGVSDEQKLSVDAVKDILEMEETGDLDDMSLDELNRSSEVEKEGEAPPVQDPKNRKPLEPELKAKVLERDKFRCQCCGIGGEAWLQALACHHIVQVSQGGPDTEENLVTVCSNCHSTIHTYAWGKIHVDLEKLTEVQKRVFKRIFRYGNKIIEADKKIGRSKEQSRKEDHGAGSHIYPGAGLGDNKKAFTKAQTNKED